MKITREVNERIESAKTMEEKIEATKLSYVENCNERDDANSHEHNRSGLKEIFERAQKLLR